MRKTFYLLMAIAALAVGCTSGPGKSELKSQNDSLRSVLAARDAAVDEMVATINMVEEGFKSINEAQGRINLDAGAEQSKMVALQKDFNFIAETLENNRKRIEELEKNLSENKAASQQLKAMVAKLKKQLEEKNREIAALKDELASKNVKIGELDKAVQELNSNVTELSAAKDRNEKTISEQDEKLNAVWYAIGTKRELKDMNIVDGKKVLQSGNAVMSYFTKADMRNLTTIETHEKSAKLLTSHPEGSYKLQRDSNKKYVLTIVDAEKFWSRTKYLVIQVR